MDEGERVSAEEGRGSLVPSMNWVEARKLPLWSSPPFSLPLGVEARKQGDLVVLCKVGTDKVVGLVASRLDPNQMPALLARLETSSPSLARANVDESSPRLGDFIDPVKPALGRLAEKAGRSLGDLKLNGDADLPGSIGMEGLEVRGHGPAHSVATSQGNGENQPSN